MFWTIIGVLLLLWVLGIVFKIASGLIHLLLIVVIVILAMRFIKYVLSG